MLHRYFAVRVSSDRGPNVYRLIGLAKDADKTHKPIRAGFPDFLILATENESEWLPTVTLSVSPLTHRYLVDCAMTVEQ